MHTIQDPWLDQLNAQMNTPRKRPCLPGVWAADVSNSRLRLVDHCLYAQV